MTEIAFVALGSNLGDRAARLANGRRAIGALPGTRLVAESAIEETEPLGAPGQSPYLNQIVAIETRLAPRELLEALLEIEKAEGRVRRGRWEPRTLDLDIVCYERTVVEEPGLVVPHPELPNREFWQRELADVRRRLAEPADAS